MAIVAQTSQSVVADAPSDVVSCEVCSCSAQFAISERQALPAGFCISVAVFAFRISIEPFEALPALSIFLAFVANLAALCFVMSGKDAEPSALRA